MEYRCLLWDFDGTLADTGSDVWNSLTYAARRAGGAIDDLYMRDDANLADPMDEIMRHVIPYPGEAYLETFDEDVRVHYRTLNDFSRTRLYPGIQSMLNELKEHGVRNIIDGMASRRDNASMWETPSATSKLHGPTASPA